MNNLLTITGIQPRRKSLQALYIDGEFYADVDRETLYISGYREEQTITHEELCDLLYDSAVSRAKNKGLYLLGFKEYTQKGMIDKLRPETGAEAAEEAVEWLAERGYINDEDYANRYAKELSERKKLTGQRLIFELKSKGVPDELARQAASELEENPQESLIALLEKRYPNYSADEKEKRRAFAALSRMGYSYSDIKKALQDDDSYYE